LDGDPLEQTVAGASADEVLSLRYARPTYYLRNSDRRYVRKPAAATGIILVAIFAEIGATSLAFIAGLVAAVPIVAAIVALGAATINMVGLWLLTKPDTAVPITARRSMTRWFIRFAGLCGVGDAGITITLCALATQRPYPAVTAFILIVSQGIIRSIELGGLFALFGYLRRLAGRMPDRGLQRTTRTVMWGYGAAHGLRLLGVVLAVAMGIARASYSLRSQAVCLTSVGSLICIIAFGLWWMILLVRYRRRLLLEVALAKTRRT